MSKGVAVAALMSVCMAAWGFGVFGAVRTDLALHKHCKADSYEGMYDPGQPTGNYPDKATDSLLGQGNRWGSYYNADHNPNPDSAWIFVDLGAKYYIDSLAIYWEHSGAKKYDVQVWNSDVDTPSYNDKGWTTIYTDTTLYYQNPPVDMCLAFLKVPVTQTRYVRIRCYKRLFNYGYSIMELLVFGNLNVQTNRESTQPQSVASSLIIIRTKIGVSIRSMGAGSNAMTAEILSPAGKLIRRLSSLKEVQWNYKDAFGNKVPNGTYLLRVISWGKIMQEKIAVYR